MAFPVSGTPYPAGSPVATPPYSGTFIPEIWSGKLIEKFYAATVLAAISNTDYEGEIKNHGDKVQIRTKPTIQINDYQADMPLAAQRPAAANVTLAIDKGKYFNCILDDVMEIQSDINMMSMWSDDAGEQMKIVIDQQVLGSSTNGGILHGADVNNKGVTAGAITHNINLGITGTPVTVIPRNPTAGQIEIIDMILRMGQALDEQNIPETGRWVVMPTWAATMVKKSELRDAALTGDGVSILRNGRLGMLDRFTLYSSNLLPSGVAGTLAAGEYAMYAGHAHGLTFASQMTKLETLRSEMTFGTLLRGLQVFGSKVLDGKAIAEAIIVGG